MFRGRRRSERKTRSRRDSIVMGSGQNGRVHGLKSGLPSSRSERTTEVWFRSKMSVGAILSLGGVVQKTGNL